LEQLIHHERTSSMMNAPSVVLMYLDATRGSLPDSLRFIDIHFRTN